VVAMTASGLFFSSFMRKTAHALAATYTLVVLMVVLTLLGGLTEGIFSPKVLEWVYRINPLTCALTQFVTLHSHQAQFLLWRPNLYFMLGATVVLLLIAAVRVRTLVRPR